MKKVICFGEIMMRLSPPAYLRFSQAQQFNVVYGGAESNVAISLSKFGIPSSFVTKIPENAFGNNVISELQKNNVATDHIITGGDRLGLYFIENGAVSRGGNVIYDRANSAMSTIKPGQIDWEEVFKDANWFHWSGITAAISESAAIVCLEALKVAKQKGLTISADLNHRAKLWQYGKKPSQIMPQLVEYCNVLLANLDDANLHLNIVPSTTKTRIEAFNSIAEQIITQFPAIHTVCSSLRTTINASHNNLQGVIYNNNTSVCSPEHQITHIVDRVGGGDAFFAGLIYGLITNKNNQETIDFATAAASIKHTIHGDANLASLEEVNLLASGSAVGRVSR